MNRMEAWSPTWTSSGDPRAVNSTHCWVPGRLERAVQEIGGGKLNDFGHAGDQESVDQLGFHESLTIPEGPCQNLMRTLGFYSEALM